MDDTVFENIETASPSVVKQAARDFAAVLAESPQFKTYELAAYTFRKDQAAQLAMLAFQQKHQSLRSLIMLNALSVEQNDELERLRCAFVDQLVVQEYFSAEAGLAALCQVLGDTISESIGLNYTAACAAACCG